MIKKTVFCILTALTLSFSVQAENGKDYYEEYDDYEEMQMDMLDEEELEEETTAVKLPGVYIPVIAAGAVIGGGAAFLALKKFFAPPEPDPYLRKPRSKHEITYRTDKTKF